MLPAPKITEQDMLDRVLWRDGLMLIINKPPGLPVHPGPGGGPNLEYYFKYLQYGLPNPPSLAHRLDRDTSGCLILGRHPKALRRLGKMFEAKRIEKTYWAICIGAPETDTGICKLALKKKSQLKTSWWMEVCADDDADAMPCETHWKVLAKAGRLSLIEFTPKTGRTHQIRVHATALGCPLLGEQIYGNLADADKQVPIHLHARSVRVPIYPAKDAVVATAPLPDHMQETLKDFTGFAVSD